MNYEEQGNLSTYKRVQVRCKQAALEDIPNLPGYVDFCQRDIVDNHDGIFQIRNPKGSDFYQGLVYGMSNYPGFCFCPQALSSSLQTHLAFQAVTDYCERPHVTNIDLLDPKPSERMNTSEETMWQLWKRERGFSANNRKDASISIKYYRSFRKLSWATAGYHYDWTARSYDEKSKSPMPVTLQHLAMLFACTSLAITNSSTESTTKNQLAFTPSASIVNYYNTKSVMGGHKDDLEYALDKPVVSFSLGLPALFLLGGKTKDDDTAVIKVRPGDVMMLGGDARLNYHGMARVLLTDRSDLHNGQHSESLVGPTASQQVTKDWLEQLSMQSQPGNAAKNASEEIDKNALALFLRQHRININVRQVYHDVTASNNEG